MYPSTQQSWWLSWTSLAQWFKDRPQLFGQILSTDLAHCLPFLSHLLQFINKFLLYNPSLSDSQFNTWPSISSISKVTSSHLPKFIFPLSKSPRVLSHTNPQKPILNHLAHFHSFSVHGSSILTPYTPSTKPLLHLHILPIHKQFLKLKALGLLSPTLKNLLPHLSHTCKGSPATSVYTFFLQMTAPSCQMAISDESSIASKDNSHSDITACKATTPLSHFTPLLWPTLLHATLLNNPDDKITQIHNLPST